MLPSEHSTHVLDRGSGAGIDDAPKLPELLVNQGVPPEASESRAAAAIKKIGVKAVTHAFIHTQTAVASVQGTW